MKKIFTLCLIAFIGTTQLNAQCSASFLGSSPNTISRIGIGQSFITFCTGYLTDFEIRQVSGPSYNYDVVVKVFAGDVNPINSTPIYSEPLLVVANTGNIYIHFTTPVLLTGGNVYTVYFQPNYSDIATFKCRTSAAGADYPYGAMWGGSVAGGGTTSTRSNAIDLIFNTSIITCTPTSSTSNLSICPSELPYTWNGLTFTDAGSQTAHLTNAGGCDSAATLNLSLKYAYPIGISSLGKTSLCNIGATTTASNSITLGGGVWSSSNPSVATATAAGNYASITAVTDGMSTITYTKTASTGCISTASCVVTVAALSSPNSITGSNTVCKAATTTLSSTTNDGVWSSLNNYASVNNAGVVTGLSAGQAVIKYTVSNASGCTAFASYNVTVNALPAIPTIGYAIGTINPQTGGGGAFCNNKNFTLVGTPSGGVWSSTGGITIGAVSGAASTVSTGAASVTYTITNAGGCSNSRTITGNVVTCASRGLATNEKLETINEFTMYPNPARNVVSLMVDKLIGNGEIIITDLYGKQMKTQQLSMGTNTIDVSKLSKGMYFVSVITSEGKTTKKLVIND